MAVNKVVYKHFEVKVSPAAAHAVDALLFGCGKIDNDLNPDYNADLVNSVAFRASECTITRVVRKNADDESTVLYDGTPVNDFYLEYEPEDENDIGLFSIMVKKTDGTNAMKVVTVPYGTNRRPVYATQDEALRTRMTQAEDDIDDLETRMTQAEGDIDDLETKVDTIEQTTIPGINSRLEALQAGEETLSKSIELLSGSVETVEENYNTLSDSVGLLTTQADDNTQEITQLKARVSALESFLSGGAGVHNSIYRGKDLGESVTEEQYAAIAAGTFDDLYIGDYWTIGGVTYRIAAFDYYLQTGDTPCTDHHVTLIPDTPMYTHVMNDTDITVGGYVGSKMYTVGLTPAKATIASAFGSAHVLTHRQYLSNAVTDGYPSGGAWYDSTVELMTEQNVYGGKIFGVANTGAVVPHLFTLDKSQFPLFARRPDMISGRSWFWLRDVVSAYGFADVFESGLANSDRSLYAGGVRPAFSIIG